MTVTARKVPEKLEMDCLFGEQNLWGRIASLSRMTDATYPEMRAAIEGLRITHESYLKSWDALRDARQKAGCPDHASGLLVPLRHSFPQCVVAENAELNALFDLQQRRMSVATIEWQKETGEYGCLPDLGKLLDWLMAKAGITVEA